MHPLSALARAHHTGLPVSVSPYPLCCLTYDHETHARQQRAECGRCAANNGSFLAFVAHHVSPPQGVVRVFGTCRLLQAVLISTVHVQLLKGMQVENVNDRAIHQQRFSEFGRSSNGRMDIQQKRCGRSTHPPTRVSRCDGFPHASHAMCFCVGTLRSSRVRLGGNYASCNGGASAKQDARMMQPAQIESSAAVTHPIANAVSFVK